MQKTKTHCLIFLLLITVLISCSDKVVNNDILTFELRLAESKPDSGLQEMVFYNSDLKFFVCDSVFLSNSDLASAEVIDRETQPKIKVILDDEGRKKFADFTLKNVGKNAAILVDNKLVSAPRINAQITEGILLIVGFFSEDEAKTMAKGILVKN